MSSVSRLTRLSVIWALVWLCLLRENVAVSKNKHQPSLSFDFYEESCPQLHQIVKETVTFYSSQDPTTPAPLLRLLFHDCFVQGCDGSVLLNSDTQNEAEKDAAINFSLSNFNVIDDIKQKLEKICPDTVSCADVLAAVAVYSIKQAGGPLYKIEFGRRDALTSYAPSSQLDLPAFHLNVSGLLQNFQNVGLDLVDLVALSGAHTIGQGHCSSISDRLYPKVDPQYQKKLGEELLRNCSNDGENVQFFNDQITPLVFDHQYFKNLRVKLGLFTSDKSLFYDPRTTKLVDFYAKNQKAFFKQFGISLRKMAKINVLTGTEGQIRKQCWVRNSGNADPAFNPVT